jgi:hypothetical protein
VVWLIGSAQSKKEPQYAKKIVLRLVVGTAFANCFDRAGVASACSAQNNTWRRGVADKMSGFSPVKWSLNDECSKKNLRSVLCAGVRQRQ